MIREEVIVKMRGSTDSLKTVSNQVRITVTGREDLDRLAKRFDKTAGEARKAGRHADAAKAEACARGCRANRLFKLTMPSDVWAKMEGAKK